MSSPTGLGLHLSLLGVEKGKDEVDSHVPKATLHIIFAQQQGLKAPLGLRVRGVTDWLVLAWRADGATPKGAATRGAPAALDSTEARRETSQVEVLLLPFRGMMIPLQADGWGEVPKSIRDLGCCSLQEMKCGLGWKTGGSVQKYGLG